MARQWVVIAKDNTFKKTIRVVIKANSKEKAKQYAIAHFHNDGYSNFHIISCSEFSSYRGV